MKPDTTQIKSENNNQGGLAAELYTWAESVVFALVAVVLLFTFFFRMVGVGGVSMEDTLNAGVQTETQFLDRLVVSGFYYTPHRGDIVAIYSKGLQEAIIKRVIAVGGDVVDIDFTKHTVSVNGKVLKEPYIKEPTCDRGDVTFPIKVPKGHIFVMGDNRNQSYDSRYKKVGMIDDRDIVGKALVRIYPFNRIRTFF